MFQVGDKIVHPMHGAGVVDSIVQKKVNGVVREYYTLKLPVGGMLVMIPTEHSDEKDRDDHFDCLTQVILLIVLAHSMSDVDGNIVP